MQTVSTEFTTRTNNRVRKLKAAAQIAFTKTKSLTTQYFTVGISTVGGPDPIGPPDNVGDITEWDKYEYTDYSSRILSMEATHEQDITGNFTMAIADVELQNTDDLFTPDVDPTIGAFVQSPRRPLRLSAGFNTQTVPIFVGLTEKAPSLSEDKKTAKFHAIDFIKSISEIKITQSEMYVDQRIDQVISDLLITYAGLATTQFSLDPGIRAVPFIYFKKDTTLGKAIQQLAQSELATFFEDEAGVLRLWNRQHLTANTTPLWTFNRDNCREIQYPDAKNVINTVEVFGNVRKVQANQKLWELASATKVPPGGTLELFGDFKDDYGDLPVTTIDTPVYLSGATTSYYATNTAQDGTGEAANTYISVTSFSQFATGFKVVFTNTAAYEIYINALEIFARPAKVISEIYTFAQDATSVGKYEEQPYKIENDFIQSEAFAKTLSTMLIADRANPSGVREIEVTRGVPQLQTGDLVTFDDGKTSGTYYVQKKTTSVGKGGLVQVLTLVKRTIQSYFTVGISMVGGTDVIAP